MVLVIQGLLYTLRWITSVLFYQFAVWCKQRILRVLIRMSFGLGAISVQWFELRRKCIPGTASWGSPSRRVRPWGAHSPEIFSSHLNKAYNSHWPLPMSTTSDQWLKILCQEHHGNKHVCILFCTSSEAASKIVLMSRGRDITKEILKSWELRASKAFEIACWDQRMLHIGFCSFFFCFSCPSSEEWSLLSNFIVIFPGQKCQSKCNWEERHAKT